MPFYLINVILFVILINVMGYYEIVLLVFFALWCALGLMLIQYALFTIIGIFAKKKYPSTDKKLKYGVIIGARNEEFVIGGLLDSINNSDYPRDKIQVFVVAHNCTDKTAEIARSKGATVYEYNNPAERTVGYAYKHLVQKINEDYGTENYDGFFIINADNTVSKNYFTKMNDAFVATEKKHIITSYRNSKNFADNYMSCLYGLYFITACRFEARGRTVCNCSTRVSGTGYVINSALLKDGWDYVTLTEDWEFSDDNIARGSKIFYCDEAEFFDEQPTTVKVMLRQRMRWARGHMIVFFTRFKALMKSLFTPKKKGGKNKYSVYDFSTSILPLGVMSILTLIIQLILTAFCPYFGYDPVKVWTFYGIVSGIGFGISYAICILQAVLLLILEHKRIPRVGFFTMLGALLVWPFFLMLNVVLDVVALFKKNLEWKEIPHCGGKKKKSKKKARATEQTQQSQI